MTMYESMKAKDAARIFDRLSLPILLKVVRQMKPRKMADVLARMSPEAAERLTVAIASNAPLPQRRPRRRSPSRRPIKRCRKSRQTERNSGFASVA
ncbi:hypothetical protein QW131_13820 [Roseibium salinum]|nr:hypothetical protein [Roseibium salinum]